MKTGYMANVCLIILFVISTGSLACAEASLRDPGIPNGERSAYTLYVGEEQTTQVEEVTVENEDGRKIYHIVSRSEFEDIEMKIGKKTMTIIFVRSVAENQGVVIDKSITLIEDKSKTEKDEIKALDFSDMKYVLRGFPFNEPRPLKITTLEDGGGGMGGNFKIEVKLLEIEELKVKNKSINCYKLGYRLSGLGVLSILKGLFPKTYFWFSVEAPHYLVRYEGSRGKGLDSPKEIMELNSYSGW